MNFCLIVLLMVPLVFAQSPDAYTYLYDSDFVIAEGYGRLEMNYKYKGNDELTFMTHNRSAEYSYRPPEESLTLSTAGQDFRNQNLSFAIDFSPDVGDCLERSSPSLHHLIKNCTQKAAIRELTEEEQAKLEDYKAHQKESSDRFEFIYERVGKKRSRGMATEVTEFEIIFYKANKGTGPPHPGSPFSAIASSSDELFNEVLVAAIDHRQLEHRMTVKDLRSSDVLSPILIKGLGDNGPGVDWAFKCDTASDHVVDLSFACTGLTKLIVLE